ncbi:uncharacterized protein EDB93DRAFT_1249795 [Suillus bovinus]|uniref:uncharacterized protein n=1 Tax=Suillus bovinus TaxID=48563 RepID=UPI001B87D1F7|nr:uncharacterized protein EDB93DRAFT_1249795 [Suillus bovinus]KAG2150222.1 hypothetical protein EDB93DRAFT_1249795 [Suillus bovinus]
MVTTRSATRVVGNDSTRATVSNPGRLVPQASTSDEDSEDPDIAPCHVKKRSKKRAGHRVKAKLKRRGRLDLMPTMNLDILYHILSFLLPMDLLNLSRTSKDFRNLLLQRSSASAWKTARLQVDGLPDCPQDMSEPQYANLAFYPHCHNCDRVVRSVLWSLRARYCPRCIGENTIDQWSAVSRFPWTLNFNSYDLPHAIIYGPGRPKQLFSKKAFDELRAEFSKTPVDEMAALLPKKQKHAAEVMKHAEQCQQWSESVASSRKDELDAIRRSRQDDIVNRLTEAGYKPELDYVNRFWLQDQLGTSFKEPKPLNQKSWDRMRPDLITALDNVRMRRIEDKIYGPRRQILMDEYNKYLQDLPPPNAAFDLMPHAVDVADFEPFRVLIMSPESATVTATSFVSAFQQLPNFVSSWRAKIDREFLDLIRCPESQGDVGKQQDADCLQLATAAFVVESGSDRRLLMYPEVLSWPGFFAPAPVTLHDEIYLLQVKQFGCRMWSAVRHSPRISVFEGTAAIVQAANLDPKTTRREHMDELDTRFACGKCSTPGRKVVMTWDMAVMHSYRLHRDLQPEEIKWAMIEGDELQNVKDYEKEAKSPAKADAIVYCALCQHHVRDALSLTSIQNHLAEIHGIPSNEVEQGTHYIPDRNSTSVISMVVDSDSKVSNHADHRLVPSYSSGVELLYWKSHLV